MFTTTVAQCTLLCIYLISRGVVTQETSISLPVTYYLEGLESASTKTTEQILYHASLCTAGINGRKRAVLQIFSSENPEWNTSYGNPYVVVQVSKCNNNFTQDCVIATNYQFGVNAVAVPKIAWTMSANDTDYWIRVMGQYKNSEFSMELSFNDTENATPYPWNGDAPFNTEIVASPAETLLQYWKGTGVYTTSNDAPKKFGLAYCKQENNDIKGIDISVAAIPSTKDYTLLQQWACPQTININDCTSTNVQTGKGWYNFGIASFNLLPCTIGNGLTTDNGIWVIVSGNGANINTQDTFTFYATEHKNS